MQKAGLVILASYTFITSDDRDIRMKLRQLIRQSWIELAGEKLRKKWEG